MSAAEILRLLVLIMGGMFFFGMLTMSLVSIRENEKPAAKRVLLLGLLLLLPYLSVGLFSFKGQIFAGVLLLVLPVLAFLLFFLPLGKKRKFGDDVPKTRFDERDIMFARVRLQPGTERFETYYRENPEKKIPDDKFREKPGLMQPGSAFYDPVAFAATDASFETVAAFHAILDRRPARSEPLALEAQEMTKFVKNWAKKLGAVSVGITELKDYHLYSTIGRGEPYGAPVDLKHKYAIALTVEMDKVLLDTAPHAPTAMESAQQYVNAGVIAVQLAEFMHLLGYPARAHIDGNYRVICPLVARDAGLGEIGRMGLLITPELGPRVRLAVVTTDLPLIADERYYDESVLDFCSRCKKCADNCPAKAIPFAERSLIEGAERWQINSEACFTYWCTAGTDCGRCMRVCPYSHPNNLLHNFVRLGIRRSALFRIFALQMDNFFYGRKPLPSPAPDWVQTGKKGKL